MSKKDDLNTAWTLYHKYPNKRSAITAKLEDYGITVDEFNDYDSTMAVNKEIGILEQRAEELEEVPGFSQIDTMSDDRILEIFQARDDLNGRLSEVGAPPTDAEWFKAGRNAEERIGILKDPYEVKKAEEWERLEYPTDILAPLMGPIGAITELVAGATDWRYDFGEKLHEKGFGTSWNPLTGFGAWDIAEFKVNPETGQQGFSPGLLGMEEELEELYGTKRQYHEQMIEGGYRDAYDIHEELTALNQIIMENQLLDPRLLGETR